MFLAERSAGGGKTSKARLLGSAFDRRPGYPRGLYEADNFIKPDRVLDIPFVLAELFMKEHLSTKSEEMPRNVMKLHSTFSCLTLLAISSSLVSSCRKEGDVGGVSSADKPPPENPAPSESAIGPESELLDSVKADADRLAMAATPEDVYHWLIGRSAALDEAQAKELANVLLRVADATGKSLEELATEILKLHGENANGGAWDLGKAMKNHPVEFVKAVQATTEGRNQTMTLLGAFSRFQEAGDAEGLHKVYISLDPGTIRTEAAASYTGAVLIKSGLKEAMNVLPQLEYPEERRRAVQTLSSHVRQGRGAEPDADSLRSLDEIARELNITSPYETQLPKLE